MNGETLLSEFRRKVCEEIAIEQEGTNRFIVYTPFMFDDGDHFVVLLRQDDAGWFVTDEGHTLMHLSYSGVNVTQGNRGRIVEESLAAHGVQNREGELLIPVPGDRFGDALYSFLQALSRVATVTQMTQERVASTFVEDFSRVVLSIVPEERAQFDWHDPTRDPEAIYSVDCRINGMPMPCFVFAVNSDAKCSYATVTCLMFEKWGVPFRSVAIFEDQTKIARKSLAQLTNVVGRQFSSLGVQERIKLHFDEILGTR